MGWVLRNCNCTRRIRRSVYVRGEGFFGGFFSRATFHVRQVRDDEDEWMLALEFFFDK